MRWSSSPLNAARFFVQKSAATSQRRRNVVIQGYPRRQEEAIALRAIVKKFDYSIRALIRINPAFESVKRRLGERLVCCVCSRYYLEFNLPEGATKCPVDAGDLTQVPFDVEGARSDFLSYNTDIAQVFDALRSDAATFFDVSGDDPEIAIFANILTKLRQGSKSQPGVYRRQSSSIIPTRHGEFEIITFQSRIDYSYHLALVKGSVDGADEVLVRVHSSCMTGDIFGSMKCECGEQLEEALARMEKVGRGVLVYLFQEGRGINIINKLRAYELQRGGSDTVDANEILGLPAEMRDYGAARDILAELGIRSVALLTNSPDKIQKLTDLCVVVADVQKIEVTPNPSNEEYLRTKKDRMGHRLDV